ncbi:MAG: outer membrane beta-barrel protein [Candidatus Pseudobacter hemicellulosilyticus]|uniref:Outer membrane beta-barrel protein n=1 Tax=Candidatus Pseudobacter hemicellulosilyticus TaxID=3121375 RepID=A0AAJ5WXD7_9BACT|nr:MAG: outer membrane beta-barrel protein [Pseudobacter sp.]
MSYQITNNRGEFSFNNLPAGLLLKVEISFIGYSNAHQLFTIPADTGFVDLKQIALSPSENTLQEVVVTVPPVSIKGDTLEFNASAFKLDSNAVVEDLLRKIPNITLWADGTITVNGREVKSFLVNGKQFFGDDAKIATQNIPKNAVDKIQAYQVHKEGANPADSTLELNVKLKKGRDRGYFGKLTAGYGTNKRYDSDASFNFFTGKMQLSAVGAANNLNKIANDVSTLISNSSFKGIGTSLMYQPNLESGDLVQSRTIGLSGEYDFRQKPAPDQVNKLSLYYFLQRNNIDNFSDITTVNTLGEQVVSSIKNNSASNADQTDHDVNARYELIRENQSLTLIQSYKASNTSGDYNNVFNTLNEQLDTTSFGMANESKRRTDNSFKMSAFYRNVLNSYEKLRGLGVFSALYSIDIANRYDNDHTISNFQSLTDPLSNRYFNRKYNNETGNIDHRFSVDLKDIYIKPGRLHFSLSNNLLLKNRDEDDLIQDYDNNTYKSNSYLSNTVQTRIVEEMPGLKIAKTINKALTNRFMKSVSFSYNIKQAFIFQNIQSEKAFQRVDNFYSRFVPEADFQYRNSQFGKYDRTISMKYNTAVTIPSLDQLAPLVDSTDFYFIRKGNAALKEAVNKSLSLQYAHVKRGVKNAFDYAFDITAGIIDNKIADSTFIAADNRRVVYFINVSGSRYINFNAAVRKSFKLANAEIQLKWTSRINFTRNPSYLNNVFLVADNTTISTDLQFNYNYKDKLAIESRLSYFRYNSRQQVFDLNYTGQNIANVFSSSYNITRKASLASNIVYRHSRFESSKDVNFCIWNASAAYRFFKGNNGELKFSALDLLRQNNNVLNYGSENSFVFGTQSTLQQYFMVTLSYYPRRFGKK